MKCETSTPVRALRGLHLRKLQAQRHGPYVAARRAMALYEALLRRYAKAVDTLLPAPVVDDALGADLLLLQRTLLRHPMAAAALYRGLIAEGRAFAATPEGAEVASQLQRSAFLRRLRVAWLSVSGNLLSEHDEAILPGQLLEALAGAAASEDVHALFADLAFGAGAPS